MHKTYFFFLFLCFIFHNKNAVYAQNKAYSETFFEIEKILKEEKEYFKCGNFTLELKNPKIEYRKEKKESYHKDVFQKSYAY